MCGIVASYAADNAAPGTPDTLKSQVEASILTIKYRGPDSSGIYVSSDGRVALGHVRLAIIDLETGDQPLHDELDEIHAIVNGELYEYDIIRAELERKGSVFRTNSDSELVVHLYKQHGLNLCSWLRGEFAFVLYDSRRDLLLAARDRFGIKPLYYTISDGRLLIASEIKAMKGMGWRPEWDVESIVQMGDFNDDRTVFKGVYKLPVSHFLTFRRTGQLKVQSYWDHSYASPEIVEHRTVDEMIEGVRKRMVESVSLRLRSDVPLGVYLSGGVDSAAVAGIAAALLKEKNPEARLSTFTLSFPDRAELDEGPIARRMASSIGADVHMVTPTEGDLVDMFEESVWHAEQPVLTLHGGGKIILSNKVRELGYKVVLTGEGADEVFGGYSFLALDYLRAIDPASRELGFLLPSADELREFLSTIEGLPPPQDHISISNMSFSDSPLGRAMLGGISTHRVLGTNGVPAEIFTETALQRFGAPDHAKTIAEGLDAKARDNAINGDWHPLHVGLYAVSKTMLSNGILNIVGERAEMTNSIEGRPPFLDHKVVEYANSLPPSVKIKPLLRGELDAVPRKWSLTEKWILREAVRPFVTDEIYNRKKSQYNVPISRPTASGNEPRLTPLQVLLKTRLTKASVEHLGWANWDYLGNLLRQYIESPESPVDGGLDKRARVLLCILSFVVMQERFGVPTYLSS